MEHTIQSSSHRHQANGLCRRAILSSRAYSHGVEKTQVHTSPFMSDTPSQAQHDPI
jgi:hypothetical protein